MSTQKTADEKPRRGWWPFGGSSSVDDEGDDEEVDERGLTAAKGRATPGRRAASDEEGGNFITRSTRGVVEYFEGVQAELNKVTWPTRDETRRLSIIVLATTIASSIALGIVAFAYSNLFRIGLAQPLLFIGFFIAVLAAGFWVYRRSNRSSNLPF